MLIFLHCFDYLIFIHDGKSFDLKDFDAITSMANSRKSDDNSKTGYKGIGFKSVFTDSLQVFIKTGGFFFSFDKTSELFDDFEGFSDNYYQRIPLVAEQYL